MKNKQSNNNKNNAWWALLLVIFWICIFIYCRSTYTIYKQFHKNPVLTEAEIVDIGLIKSCIDFTYESLFYPQKCRRYNYVVQLTLQGEKQSLYDSNIAMLQYAPWQKTVFPKTHVFKSREDAMGYITSLLANATTTTTTIATPSLSSSPSTKKGNKMDLAKPLYKINVYLGCHNKKDTPAFHNKMICFVDNSVYIVPVTSFVCILCISFYYLWEYCIKKKLQVLAHHLSYITYPSFYTIKQGK